jgi:hypothetical protein
MLWEFGGWLLLLCHFFFPDPYREQLLAAQTVFIAFCPKLMSFHVATGIIWLLYLLNLNESSLDLVVELAHHVAVFISVISEFYFKKWRWTCWIFLCWSLRWMNPSNIYVDHPLRAVLRCVLFGLVTQRNFSLDGSIRWCWIFLVHEGFCILVPIQMLYSVYAVQKNRRTEETQLV